VGKRGVTGNVAGKHARARKLAGARASLLARAAKLARALVSWRAH
jgi:hypothetical protein